MTKYKIVTIFYCVLFFISQAQTDSSLQLSNRASLKAYDMLNIPALSHANKEDIIKVAVVDCGFNMNHQAIKNFIYRNPKEINGNNKDDDENGYVDDIQGWDIADQDNNVSIPAGRESFFYHGTMIAGAITQIAQRCFGDNASKLINIIPVKAMNNQATKTYMESGYEGIEYAIKSHADIIVCAWSGGKYDKEKYGHLFLEAQKKGILILGAAGNFYSEQCDPPSSISTVYVVSAVDTLFKKMKNANYGQKVDLSAPGEFVYAPHPSKENTYGYNDGTSAAVSLIGGCAAILKVLKPKASPDEIMRALKNTAQPIDSCNSSYSGKLGAGFPDLDKASQYLISKTSKDIYLNSKRAEGDIVIEKTSSKTSWDIASTGGIKGYHFSLKGEWKDSKSPIQFYFHDSLLASYSPKEFPINLFIQSPQVHVEYRGKKGNSASIISYDALPIDSTKLYCKDTRRYENPYDEIGDGSGSSNYANNCDCKWQITAPVGKRIKIEFDELDTQAKIDYVSLFDGIYTMPENILGSFSGPDLPPIIVSTTNEVLIWFVTDSNTTSQGWHLNYSFTDEEAGVKPPLKNKNK